MSTVHDRRECGVAQQDDLSRTTGLVQEHRDHRGALRTLKHHELEQKAKMRGLKAIRDQANR